MLNPVVNWHLSIISALLTIVAIVAAFRVSKPMLQVVAAFALGAVIAGCIMAALGKIPAGDEDGEVAFWLCMIASFGWLSFCAGRLSSERTNG